MHTDMACLFCGSKTVQDSGLPLNRYNSKVFTCLTCTGCGLIMVDPIPSRDDLEKMYPPSYQQGVSKAKIDSHKKQPGLRFSYDRLFALIRLKGTAAKVVDFGCGNGQFVSNALEQNIAIEGVEFNATQVEALNVSIPETRFYTVDAFFESAQRYDVIVLSNVLEHFTEPVEMGKALLGKLNSNGVLLVEGPLEGNKSLVNAVKWLYLRIRKRLHRSYETSHAPTHIFYSNYDNQIRFFEQLGLKTVHYQTTENSWPYPETIKGCKTPGLFLKYLIGLFSKGLAFFTVRYGNTFIYAGEKR